MYLIKFYIFLNCLFIATYSQALSIDSDNEWLVEHLIKGINLDTKQLLTVRDSFPEYRVYFSEKKIQKEVYEEFLKESKE